MRFFLSLAALASMLLTGVAKAEMFTLMGVGTSSCGAWAKVRHDPNLPMGAAMSEQWILGFLSGIGYEGAELDPLKNTDVGGVFGWIDNYCQAHPLDPISKAGVAFRFFHPG